MIIGRGHISRIIKDKGYAKDYNEANSYLKSLKKTKSYGVRVEEAIKTIHDAKGIAIMAHPYSLKKDDETLFNKIKYYKDNHGLDGIECIHTRQSKEKIEKYLVIAKKLDLLVSGGSDYHGDYKPDVRLGKGKGKEFFVDYQYLIDMKNYYNKL
ncbi:MAG: hypothetical protein BWY78_00786 [Alphaproteobacteria bacterium ADurb.Bin438]|nr:MAG: hypothetical protein BWY78_00786 [Alphaproteobacteria bacterium ADurb.Bin438]